MADSTTSKKLRQGSGVSDLFEPLMPVCHTVSGHKAAQDAAGTVAYYTRLAGQLWMPPRVRDLADGVLSQVRAGRSRWASISGPYGYGKTAAGITIWRHARAQGFTAVPPLSCSDFGEFAHGVACVVAGQHPQGRAAVEKLFRQVWERGLDEAVRGDAARYQLPARSVRKLLQDKIRAGQLDLGGQCHRLVEFLSGLGHLATSWSQGLVVVLDEVQQLLGPLDTRAVVRFREFVWGMRTEQSPCGVIVCLDAVLEARLARWAADLIHRIREGGPTLSLADVYTRDFPGWLWGRLAAGDDGLPRVPGHAVAAGVLESLGQFVERPDLANGPRTVVDVFGRAIAHFAETGRPYGVPDLTSDLRAGLFRYFGEGATVQRVLTDVLRDAWVASDSDRSALVQTLAAFPHGCPPDVARECVGSARRLASAREAVFGPLLVELPGGLALERLQQVRHQVADWERILAGCWDTLPSLDGLCGHAPDMAWRVFGPRLFSDAAGSAAHWERMSGDGVAALTGWRLLRGSFDEAFPQRDIAVWVGVALPLDWPPDVDLAIAFVCDPRPEALAAADLNCDSPVPRLTIRMPLVRPLGYVPAELERYRKYVQPEPFRAVGVLAALHELESITEPSCVGAAAFAAVAAEFLIGEVIQGEVTLASRQRVGQRGVGLIRALFSAACRSKYPQYSTLVTHRNWSNSVASYRSALRTCALSPDQRRGRAAVSGSKSAVLQTLFGQKSTAAGDSLLRALGPLVDASGTAEHFALVLRQHPGEAVVLNYLRKTGRKRIVPVAAVCEALRHAGYLPGESDALVGILVDRGLVAEFEGGVRLLLADRPEREAALADLELVTARLARLDGHPSRSPDPADLPLRELWASLDLARRQLTDQIAARTASVTHRRKWLWRLLGEVRAAEVPETWVGTALAAHLSGVGKLLLRTKASLTQALEREARRLDAELGKAESAAEDWAVAWRKRLPSFERDWQGIEARAAQFQSQVSSLRAWLPLNDRYGSLASLASKLAASDPALLRQVAELGDDLRERFATGDWAAIHAHAEAGARLGTLEALTQGLAFSRAEAYLAELEVLRVRFGDFLDGPSPAYGDCAAAFARLYDWSGRKFTAAAQRLRARRAAGQAWRHPCRKGVSWPEIDGQLARALAAETHADFAALLKFGELLALARQGFLAAAADRGNTTYAGPEAAIDLAELAQLVADGLVSVRIDWVERS